MSESLKTRKAKILNSVLDVSVMVDIFARYYPDADIVSIKDYINFVYNRRIEGSTNLYIENHHLIPKSIDKEYEHDDFNLFSLTYTDHICAHYLFWKAVGHLDGGTALRALTAVCMNNDLRGFYYPTALIEYFIDVANGNRKEKEFNIVYANKHGLDIDIDLTEFEDEFGIMMLSESEIMSINDGCADTIAKIKDDLSKRNTVITEFEDSKICNKSYTLNEWHDFDLITNEYLQPVAQDDIELPYRYKPYPFQAEIIDEFFSMLEGESTRKRFALELHRRAGKDVTFFQLVTAAACTVPGDYAYMLPTHTQAKKVIWNGTVNDDKGEPCKFADFIPPAMYPNLKSSDNRIELANGSNIYVIGSDNYNSLVGMNLKGVVFSEWSLCDPLAYDYIAPMLRRNAKLNPLTGWALFCWTPRGKNHAFKTRQIALQEKNTNLWYFMSKTIEDTTDVNGNRLISDQDIQEELDSGADPDKIQQEYYLSYDAAVKGIIYGKQMQIAREEQRVRHVNIDPKKEVLTFFDLGVSDETAIWFAQIDNEKINLINYYQNSGEGLEHYVDYMKHFAGNNGIKYGKVYFPHDGRNQEFITGQRRHNAMAEYGFDVQIIPRTQDLELAIRQTKQIFNRFVFNEDKCFHGIQCLENYRRKLSTDGYEGKPHHDEFSNGADALRQIGQFYADKYVSKDHDEDYMNSIQRELDEELMMQGYGQFTYDYDEVY